MAAWFRKGLSPHHTALAMIGAKSGDRVAIVGAAEPDLAAELALVTGLNGQTAVVDEHPDAQARVDAAAGKAGALVDFIHSGYSSLPFAEHALDIVVVLRFGAVQATTRAQLLAEALRALRASGRVIVADGARRTGLFSAAQQTGPRLDQASVLDALTGAGARAQRLLADVDGVAYYEARK